MTNDFFSNLFKTIMSGGPGNFEVNDRKSFQQFLGLLQFDLRHNPDKWENISLLDFLDAMARYANDIQGYYDNTNQDVDADVASWRLFKDIMMGASIYE